MKARTNAHSLDRAAEKALALARQMAWRKQRYGQACLTVREVEAVWLSAYALAPSVSGRQRAEKVSEYVASRMGVSQQWANKLLRNAAAVMEYLADSPNPPRWRIDDGGYWLDAPMAGTPPVLPRIEAARAEAIA